MPYGTPFDLSDFNDTPDFPNVINYVKIVDVVGSINPLLGTKDSKGSVINDPWPTNFASSGFDLDAVGVINQLPVNSIIPFTSQPIINFENPQNAFEPICFNIKSQNQRLNSINSFQVEIYDAVGNPVFKTSTIPSKSTGSTYLVELNPDLKPGLYLIQFYGENIHSTQRCKLLLQ
jgi:hypothetical protein